LRQSLRRPSSPFNIGEASNSWRNKPERRSTGKSCGDGCLPKHKLADLNSLAYLPFSQVMAPTRVELKSLSRALEILDILDHAPSSSGVRMSYLVRCLRVDKTTVARSIAALVARGYVTKLPNCHYAIGARAMFMGACRNEPIVRKTSQHLVDIASVTGETASLLQLVDDKVVVVARTVARRRQTRAVEDDTICPLSSSAGGQALLSCLSASARLGLLSAKMSTAQDAWSWQQVDNALRDGRRRGYFAETGGVDPSLACYAIPLVAPGRPEALAVAITFEAGATLDRRAELNKRIVGMAADLSRSL